MNPLALSTIAQMAGGKMLGSQGARYATRICTDSRFVQPGDVFVALQGEHFDGHDYLPHLAERGAVAAIISKPELHGKVKESFELIIVEDTLKGLQRLAQAYRQTLPTKIVAVTGSNGKTSTKEMIAAVLSAKFKTHKTTANLNNHIGVPLTLLQLKTDHEWAVVEMGMNHPGELEPLVEMADPCWGVITKIGWAHIEAFENQEGIALEKASVIRTLKTTGKAFLNAEDHYYRFLKNQTNGEIFSVGREDSATLKIQLKKISQSSATFSFTFNEKEYCAEIQVPAWHMLENAALAVAVGLEAGISPETICAALAKCDLGKNRLNMIPYEQGFLIDDTYNASPDSMQAAFLAMEQLPVPGRRVALLGSMGELGKFSDQLHRQVGHQAIKSGVSLICAYGFGAEQIVEGAREAGATEKHFRIFDSHEMLYNYFESTRLASDVILVKGSRSQRMEVVVQLLKNKKQGGLPLCSTI